MFFFQVISLGEAVVIARNLGLEGWGVTSFEQDVDLAVDAIHVGHVLLHRQIHHGAQGPLHIPLGGHGSNPVLVSGEQLREAAAGCVRGDEVLERLQGGGSPVEEAEGGVGGPDDPCVLGEGRGGGAAVGHEARRLLAAAGGVHGYVVDALEGDEDEGEAGDRNSRGDDVSAHGEGSGDGGAEGADEEGGLDLGQAPFLWMRARASAAARHSFIILPNSVRVLLGLFRLPSKRGASRY
jgi:hypothetical protein